MAVRNLVDQYLSEARNALRFAPLELAYSMALALMFSLAVVVEDNDLWEIVGRITLAGTVALPLVLAFSLLGAAGKVATATRAIVQVVALAVGLLWAFVGLDTDRSSTLWQTAFLCAASLFVLVAAPSAIAPDRETRNLQFWSTNLRLLTRATVVSVFAQILYAGFAGVLASINVLFELNIGEKPFLLLFAVVGLALAPFLLAGGIPSFVHRPKPDDPAPPAAGWLTAYLFGPLFVAYLAVVYAYHMKALITWEMPKNLLSPLILVASAFAIAGAAMSVPLKPGTTGSGVARVMRLWPALVLPLLPLAGYAVWVRIADYGFTEFRYIRLALVVAVATAGVVNLAASVVRRSTPWATTALVFATVSLIAAAPFVGASAVSLRSQEARVRDLLVAIGVDVEAGWPVNAVVVTPGSTPTSNGATLIHATDDQSRSLSSAMRYICQSRGIEYATKLVGYPGNLADQGCWGLDSALGISSSYVYEPDASGRITHYYSVEERPARGIMAGDLYTVYVSNYDGRGAQGIPTADTPAVLGIRADGSTFTIDTDDDRRFSANLAEFGQTLATVAPRWDQLPADVPNVFTLEGPDGTAQMIVRYAEVIVEPSPNGQRFVGFSSVRAAIIVPSR